MCTEETVDSKVTFIAPWHVLKVSDVACQGDRVPSMNQVHKSVLIFVGIQTSARGARVAKLNRVEHTGTQAHICANVCEERIKSVILHQWAFLIQCKARHFFFFSFQASLLSRLFQLNCISWVQVWVFVCVCVCACISVCAFHRGWLTNDGWWNWDIENERAKPCVR